MRHLLTLAFFGWLCWIIYLADTAQRFFIFELIQEVPGGDKVGHFCLFGGLAWLLNRSLRYRCLRLGPVSLQWGAVLVMIFATGEEFTQQLFPNRNFDWVDLLADFCGIAVFSLLQLGWHCRRSGSPIPPG
jgi:hypothetical protein